MSGAGLTRRARALNRAHDVILILAVRGDQRLLDEANLPMLLAPAGLSRASWTQPGVPYNPASSQFGRHHYTLTAPDGTRDLLQSIMESLARGLSALPGVGTAAEDITRLGRLLMAAVAEKR